MKKIIIIFFCFFASNFLAQDNLFVKVKEQLKKQHPELQIENKLIVINVWSSNDAESRNANAELNKTASTFEYAKLKGGRRGMIAVVINSDESENLSVITLGKDKITKAIALSKADLDVSAVKTVAFDSDGNKVYSSIPSKDIFSSIQKLITR
ncbi:MAG: hypothetical protein H0W61_16055 [Bacteroidetes bacterium]|nr:hypothetical protein [Bacteroidota bacterium]